jgi:DNA polymerase-3 subunit gamma/tau
MSYQVLARKWRPRTFGEMVGQEHVLRALTNALDSGRLHHAFLFTGTRGVGKTTVARILAKSLNCEQGVSAHPCGSCAACVAIDENRFVDLLEVDAASRTKVEDTRDLLDNVPYAPTAGRYKVYLIDEVHMLSTHSFNALLKTLEEPPPHVKFLLATTDPQRLPVTVLSRCLQFNLKRLPREQIEGQLGRILEREAVAAQPAALRLISRAAEGSMRDALSLLDQAIAYGGGQLVEQDVRDMLGGIEQRHLQGLLGALAEGSGENLLQEVAGLAEQGRDFEGVLAELVSYLHRLALAQAVPSTLPDDDPDAATIGALVAALTPEDVQLYYQIALSGRRDLPLAPDPRAGFEMLMLRMLAFRPVGESAVMADDRPRSPAHTAAPVAPSRQQAGVPAPESSASGPPDWATLAASLELVGVARELALNCALQRWENDALDLVLQPGHAQLLSPERQKRIAEALAARQGRSLRVRITVGQAPGETPAERRDREQAERQQGAEQAIREDAVVQSLERVFDASVVPDSVRPLRR